MVNVRSKMSDEKKNNTRQIVSSVGNSWIVTQSKSHPGYVYYFNTTTGEAVWNLGDAENEKAAMKTQESEPGSKFFACAEPKDKPPTLRPLNKPFNQNNRFHQQQNPTFKIIQQQQQAGEMFGQHPEVNIVKSQQQSTSVYPDLPMNNLNSFDLNVLSNQINAYNVISTPNVFTPNSWPIPRTQQIIITPTIPLVNQAQTNASLNVAYNQLITDDHTTSSRFNNFQSSPNRRKRLFQPRNNFRRENQRNQSLSFLNANDLRQQLYLKRRMNNIAYQRKSTLVSEDLENNTNESASAITSNAETPAVSSYIENMKEEESISHKKNEIMDNNMTDTPLSKEGGPSKLDLTPLKSLASSTAELDSLYIVVDLRVLLDEFNLLSAMADSDECCQLVVPDNVMSDLKDYISCSNNIPARCIYRSLSQLIQNSCAFVAGKCTQDYGHTITNPILKTCLQLFEQNVHVILLAKDNELLNCKKFIRINIFSVDEVKSLINWEPLKYPPKNPSVSHLSNIPAPKTSPFNHKPLQRKRTVIEAPIEDTMIEGDDPVTVPSHKEKTDAATAVLSVKNTSDAAIQTETVTVISYDTNTDSLDSQIQNIPKRANNTEILKESLNESNNTVRTSLPNTKREIKLKRCISNQPLQSTSTVKSNEKKPFRWRRNRNSNLLASTTHNNEKPSTVTQNDSTVASVQIDATIGTEKQIDEIPNNKREMEQQSTDIVESSGSSIICVDIRKENITIEETSTSGIISNTESNIDADIEYRTFDDYQHDKSKMAKYDIDSESMEESLKTKCEEWISRFVQIMEEVLAVVLHKEAAFSNIEFPPPWTLHEAAQCIGKYCNNTSVKHVTDRLSRILFDLSDHAGKICLNMTPSQYMEMYSCSVSLLNEIKAITTCEDIEIAEESLQKLLADIKNPCYGSTDSIINPQEDSQNIQITSIDSEQTDFESPKRHNSSYNLRSGRLKKVLDKPVKVYVDTKSAFFSNLSLMEVKSANTTDNVNTSCGSPANERTKLSSSNGKDKDNQLNRINIVRNFTKCAELEEKLKNKLNTKTIEDNKEYLDYENDYTNTLADCRSDECNVSDEDSVISNPNVTHEHDTSDVSENIVANSAKTVDPSLASNSNNTFKLMICVFLDEVGKAIKEVKVLCDKCYAELKRPQLPTKERNELENQVENAHCNIVGLCFSLGGMLSRDPNAPYDNMRTALMKAGINISQIDRNLILEYWKTIATCKKNVDDILNSIHDIMTAFKT